MHSGDTALPAVERAERGGPRRQRGRGAANARGTPRGVRGRRERLTRGLPCRRDRLEEVFFLFPGRSGRETEALGDETAVPGWRLCPRAVWADARAGAGVSGRRGKVLLPPPW